MYQQEPQTDLFAALCRHLGVQPDRHGEVHVTCPWCGKESKPGQVHFSFGEEGGYCFVCGQSAGLRRLARIWGLDDGRSPEVPTPPRPRPRKKPRPVPRFDMGALARVGERAQDRFEAWRTYKPLPDETIEGYRLGLGVLPEYSSRCRHTRLLVPLIAEGRVVGCRARELNCNCGKWLSPAGSRMILYNGERLGKRGPTLGLALGTRRAARRLLFVVENPIDALMLELQDPRVAAVATLGVTMWQSEWTPLVAGCGALHVIVAYDNDRPGNGGGELGRQAWLQDHPRDIMPNGVKLVNKLLEAGVKAWLYPWGDAPLSADIGDVIKARMAA